jgi:hypothetical protein
MKKWPSKDAVCFVEMENKKYNTVRTASKYNTV